MVDRRSKPGVNRRLLLQFQRAAPAPAEMGFEFAQLRHGELARMIERREIGHITAVHRLSCALMTGVNFSRKDRLARLNLDITVPIGSDRICDSSRHVNPSTTPNRSTVR